MVKKLLLALALGLVFGGAQAQLSCDQVNEVGEALTNLGVALEEGVEIGEDSPEHHQLLEITGDLATIAEAEGDEDLANASIGMADAWVSNDRGAFTDALALAVAKLAVVATTECE